MPKPPPNASPALKKIENSSPLVTRVESSILCRLASALFKRSLVYLAANEARPFYSVFLSDSPSLSTRSPGKFHTKTRRGRSAAKINRTFTTDPVVFRLTQRQLSLGWLFRKGRSGPSRSNAPAACLGEEYPARGRI